jgi:hypothetical protein
LLLLSLAQAVLFHESTLLRRQAILSFFEDLLEDAISFLLIGYDAVWSMNTQARA